MSKKIHISSNPDTMRLELGEAHMQRGGNPLDQYYAPKARPSTGLRRGRSDVDFDVAVPRGLARGFVAGAAGAPGDLELISRLLANTPGVAAYGQATGAATPGKYREGEVGLQTRLPTSEEIEERLPFRGTSPLERAATGLGMIGGGFYSGPGAPIRAVTAIPSAIGKAGRDFVMAAGQTVSPLTVYHGSPHRFPPTAKNPLGEFDRTKIGTGEGAQAYGYGHYVAEAPKVANEYKKKLSNKNPARQQPDLAYDAANLSYALDDLGYEMPMGSDIQKKLDYARKALAETSDPSLKEAIDALQIKFNAYGPGYLYKIDLPDEQIARMLDYDKPLYRQTPEVRRAIRSVVDENTAPGTYAQWVRAARPDMKTLQNDLLEGMDNAQIAEALRQKGVPGIRYLDQGSRGDGQGTSNFVVFPGEEEALNILERKKVGGAVGMAGGKAEGGQVHVSSNPDTMRLEVNERRLGAGGFLAKAVKGAAKPSAGPAFGAYGYTDDLLRRERGSFASVFGVDYGQTLAPSFEFAPVKRLNTTEKVDEAKVRSLMQAMKESGNTLDNRIPPVVVDSAGNVLDGHHRVEAARRLGYDQVPIIEKFDRQSGPKFGDEYAEGGAISADDLTIEERPL